FHHTCVDALREQKPIRPAAVVVLARGDVAGAACEIDVRRSILLRPRFAGEPDEITRHLTIAVVAHRMRRIEMQRCELLITVPNANGLEPRIDETFRLRAKLGVFAGAAAPSRELAAYAYYPAIRCHFLRLGLPVTDVRGDMCVSHRSPDCIRSAFDSAF